MFTKEFAASKSLLRSSYSRAAQMLFFDRILDLGRAWDRDCGRSALWRDDHAGRAKAALYRAAGGERIGIHIPFACG